MLLFVLSKLAVLCQHIAHPALLCAKVKVKIGVICKTKVAHAYKQIIIGHKGNRFFINSNVLFIFFVFYLQKVIAIHILRTNDSDIRSEIGNITHIHQQEDSSFNAIELSSFESECRHPQHQDAHENHYHVNS